VTVDPTSECRVAGRVVGESPLRVWGLPSAVRLQRQFARVGATADAASAERQLLLRADWVYDEALVRGLAASRVDVALVGPDGAVVAASVGAAAADAAARQLGDGQAPAGTRRVTPAELADGYNDALRKREPPYLLPLTHEALPQIEQRVFGASYKGVTDLVTLYVWPRPARAVTRFCANTGITPNQVTSASLVLVLAAMALFWTGHYASGLVAAWAMTFLDTVDGKLARVTLQSSPLGNVYDHGIDLIHPPFWWWAWIVGLPAAGFALEHAGLVLTAIVAGYVLQRVEEGIFIACFKMDMHVWRRFDSRFRLVTARRNPNLLILTASVVVGRPDLGILAVAVWTVLSLIVHALRLLQAALARRHGPLRSWLAAA
jgi:phosphatidylglycerophosphate synthase